MDKLDFDNNEGVTVSIEQDGDACNPRTEYDNVGVMVCFHSRYTLGDSDHGWLWRHCAANRFGARYCFDIDDGVRNHCGSHRYCFSRIDQCSQKKSHCTTLR